MYLAVCRSVYLLPACLAGCFSVCLPVCLPNCLSTYLSSLTDVYVHNHMRTRTHTHIYIYIIFTHTHTYIYIFSLYLHLCICRGWVLVRFPRRILCSWELPGTFFEFLAFFQWSSWPPLHLPWPGSEDRLFRPLAWLCPRSCGCAENPSSHCPVNCKANASGWLRCHCLGCHKGDDPVGPCCQRVHIIWVASCAGGWCSKATQFRHMPHLKS